MNCANISYISLSTFLLIRDESGHARWDTVERNGRIFTWREVAEHWTGGEGDSSTRSSSHTRGSNEIREEGRKSVLKNEHGVHNQ